MESCVKKWREPTVVISADFQNKQLVAQHGQLSAEIGPISIGQQGSQFRMDFGLLVQELPDGDGNVGGSLVGGGGRRRLGRHTAAFFSSTDLTLSAQLTAPGLLNRT